MKNSIVPHCELGLILLVILSGGCRTQGPFEYVPVSGRLTYEDGTLLKAESIRLGFVALDRGDDMQQRPRPAKAPINVSDGTFGHATSHKFADGLIPGKHKVVIVARNAQGTHAGVVPEEYTSAATTPLVIDTADAPLHIKVPKP